MSTLSALAARLRRLRLRHGLTQEEFAEIAGLSYKFYQQIEAGRKKQVWLETIERLAAGFGLEAWQLLAPEDPSHTAIAAPRKVDPARRGPRTPHLEEKSGIRAVAEEPATYGKASLAKTARSRPAARKK